MDNLNLVLRFTLQNDGDLHVVGATRITVDGRGTLLVHDPRSGATGRIGLAQVQSLSIHSTRQG